MTKLRISKGKGFNEQRTASRRAVEEKLMARPTENLASNLPAIDRLAGDEDAAADRPPRLSGGTTLPELRRVLPVLGMPLPKTVPYWPTCRRFLLLQEVIFRHRQGALPLARVVEDSAGARNNGLGVDSSETFLAVWSYVAEARLGAAVASFKQ